MGPLRRSGVGAGEGSGDKEGEKSLSVCLQPRDDRRGCRPVDGGAEAQSAAAGSRRGYSEAGGCSLVGLGSSAASHRDGRFVVRAAASRTGAGVGVFAFVGERGGTLSRVVQAGESRELEFKMLRGRGAESSKLGAVMGGSRVGGSWAPVSLEERVCAKIQCGGPVGSRSLLKTVKYCPASTTYFISCGPERWLATPVLLVGQMDLSTHYPVSRARQ